MAYVLRKAYSEWKLMSGSDGTNNQMDSVVPADDALNSNQKDRRAVVRTGIKLAFVSPIISTFFARDAYAATYSCSPVGNMCAADADCCSNNCNTGAGTCQL